MKIRAAHIIDQVGTGRFARAAQHVWVEATLAVRGEATSNPQAVYDTLTEAVDVVFATRETAEKQIELLSHLYRMAPSFTLLDHLYVFYWKALSELGREQFWMFTRDVLNVKDDRRSWLLSMLCGRLLRGRETVGAASRGTFRPLHLNRRGIARLLAASGPVPYSLKSTAYDHLLQNREHHPAIFASILHSTFDLYGQCEPSDGLFVLGRLDLRSDHPLRVRLEDELQSRIPEPSPRTRSKSSSRSKRYGRPRQWDPK